MYLAPMLEHAHVIACKFASNRQTLEVLVGPFKRTLTQLDSLYDLRECWILVVIKRTAATVGAAIF